eukprot:gb/GECG01014150.1/.p1 GENE.gb/GECG01014150.1/~~gb/GECG01014150.1/.p1  ORF type:complete len:333 (+),score=37.38 gb/GECG01014150.1/:1-999(+)
MCHKTSDNANKLRSNTSKTTKPKPKGQTSDDKVTASTGKDPRSGKKRDSANTKSHKTSESKKRDWHRARVSDTIIQASDEKAGNGKKRDSADTKCWEKSPHKSYKASESKKRGRHRGRASNTIIQASNHQLTVTMPNTRRGREATGNGKNSPHKSQKTSESKTTNGHRARVTNSIQTSQDKLTETTVNDARSGKKRERVNMECWKNTPHKSQKISESNVERTANTSNPDGCYLNLSPSEHDTNSNKKSPTTIEVSSKPNGHQNVVKRLRNRDQNHQETIAAKLYRQACQMTGDSVKTITRCCYTSLAKARPPMTPSAGLDQIVVSSFEQAPT